MKMRNIGAGVGSFYMPSKKIDKEIRCELCGSPMRAEMTDEGIVYKCPLGHDSTELII
jgi:hypothetical protein